MTAQRLAPSSHPRVLNLIRPGTVRVGCVELTALQEQLEGFLSAQLAWLVASYTADDAYIVGTLPQLHLPNFEALPRPKLPISKQSFQAANRAACKGLNEVLVKHHGVGQRALKDGAEKDDARKRFQR